MGYNLTNERIQDTYEQLVQISGSILVDGTGSAVSFSTPSASFSTYASTAGTATTASFALNAAGTVTEAVFNAYTSSASSSIASKTPLSIYTPFSASVAAQLEPLVAGSGSADWDLITNIPAGLVSGSSQTVAYLVGVNLVASSLRLTNAITAVSVTFGSIGDLGGITILTADQNNTGVRI